jgi:hypothetical protein
VSYNRTYVPGDRLVECDVCGFAYRRSDMRKGVGQQKGLTVCPNDFDGVHPLDLPVKNRPEGRLEEIR